MHAECSPGGRRSIVW